MLAVHLVYTVAELPELRGNVSGDALRWLGIIVHPSIEPCYRTVLCQGMTIYATYFGDPANSRAPSQVRSDPPDRAGLRQRAAGVSKEARAAADENILIPMMGMVRSLNISVACAVALSEALRQRRLAGHDYRPQRAVSPSAEPACAAGSSTRRTPSS